MDYAYFVTAANIIDGSSLNKGVDETKLNHIIEAVQDIHIQDVTGQELFEKLQADIIGGTLEGDYETLVDKYIAPYMIAKCVEMFIPEHAFTMKNGGIFKHFADNGQTIETNELNYLQNQYEKRADYYQKRMINYLCDNEDKFVEYRSNSDYDIQPRKGKNTLGGWYL